MQNSTVPLMTAVVEATRAQETAAAQYATQLVEAKKELTTTIAAFTEQIRVLNEKHFLDCEHLRNQEQAASEKAAGLGEKVSSSTASVAELQTAIRSLEQEHASAVSKLIEEREAAIKTLLRSGFCLLTEAHEVQRTYLVDVAVGKVKLIDTQESAFRARIVALCIQERARLVDDELWKALRERDTSIVRLQSDIASQMRNTNSEEAAHQATVAALNQRIRGLEDAATEERGRAAAVNAQLRETQSNLSQLRTSHEAFVASMKEDRAALHAEAASLTESLAQRRAAETAAVGRAEEAEGRARALEVDLTATAKQLADAKAAAEATEVALRREMGEARHEAETFVQTLRQQLHEEMVSEQRKALAAVESQAAALLEKSVALEALTQRADISDASAQSAQAANETLAHRLSELRAQLNNTAERAAHLTEELRTAQIERDQFIAASAAASKAAKECEAAREHCKAAMATAAADAVTQSNRLLAEQEAKFGAERVALVARVNGLTQELQLSRSETSAARDAAAVHATEAEQLKESASLGEKTREVLQRLSLRSQECDELREENMALREKVMLLEARFATTETRLHHSLQEGANTSVLLERGLRKLHQSTMLASETAEMKNILVQCSSTLRRALEEQGYDLATLPLAPSTALDLPYLQQVLVDHSTLCAQHFKKMSGQGGPFAASSVPSAIRTPYVYRATND